jgi:cathepsin E
LCEDTAVSDISPGTLRPDKNITIPTVTDNAYSQGLIPANEIGISFEPTDSVYISNGELVWGKYFHWLTGKEKI